MPPLSHDSWRDAYLREVQRRESGRGHRPAPPRHVPPLLRQVKATGLSGAGAGAAQEHLRRVMQTIRQ